MTMLLNGQTSFAIDAHVPSAADIVYCATPLVETFLLISSFQSAVAVIDGVQQN